MTLKEKLYKAICEKNIPQKDIAKKAGINEMTLSGIWLEKTEPKKKTVLLLEKALDEMLGEME